MASALPIACTLGAGDQKARAAELRALGEDGLVSSATTGAKAVLRFRPEPGIRARVEAIAAAEAECCAFLDFTVEHGEGATVLTIAGPDEAAAAVEQLAGAFSPQGSARP